MNEPVVLINLFSVPEGKEERFFQWWEKGRETLIKGPGFVTGMLYRSLDAGVKFNFINVAQWESDLYSEAYHRSAPSMQAELAQLGIEMAPGFYSTFLKY
ncbi:antibiotic biosynthesis monooxygenase family protein [Nitrospira sp. Nam74]